MISSEVQRTLVKSPPELWAELSDQEALARHLGALGEIRITRTEPEQLVEWEADGTTGAVHIKPSGWGTKVTLSVTRELAGEAGDEPAGAAGEEYAPRVEQASDAETADDPGTHAEPAPEAEAEPVGAEAKAEAGPDADAEVQAPAGAEPAIAAEPEPRLGFFARLFGRRRRPRPAKIAQRHVDEHGSGDADVEEDDPSARQPFVPPHTEAGRRVPGSAIDALQTRYARAVTADGSVADERTVAEDAAAPRDEPVAAQPELPTEATVDTQVDPADEQAAEGAAEQAAEGAARASTDLAAELKAAEEVVAEEVTAVLTAVLDRLGAAHHRPFSRA